MTARKGRPPIASEKRRSRNLPFRSRDELHQKLTEAARIAGRSLSEEIERRLDHSFFIREQDAPIGIASENVRIALDQISALTTSIKAAMGIES